MTSWNTGSSSIGSFVPTGVWGFVHTEPTVSNFFCLRVCNLRLDPCYLTTAYDRREQTPEPCSRVDAELGQETQRGAESHDLAAITGQGLTYLLSTHGC
jgi:hypothetical protein